MLIIPLKCVHATWNGLENKALGIRRHMHLTISDEGNYPPSWNQFVLLVGTRTSTFAIDMPDNNFSKHSRVWCRHHR